MTTSSTTMTATPVSKKGRRFSLIRLFNSNSNNGNNNNGIASSTSSGSLSPVDESCFRHSMDPSSNSSSTSINSMQSEIMHERRKSIAALTENSFRSKSFDLRRPSAIRPILSRKETPQVEMTEKMRQFDELIQTRRTGTIKLTLTPTLLQGP